MFYPDNFPEPVDKVLKAAEDIIAAFKKDKRLDGSKFLRVVKNLSAKNFLAPIPSWALFLIYFRQKKLTPKLKKFLMIKHVRSWSGIVPVSIFTKNFGCPARCVFCPTEARVPKSYFSDEPAVMRAIRNKYDAFKQVSSRLTQLFLSGHAIEKIELIIQGGTFSAINNKYREHFVKRAFDAANNDIAKLILSNKKSSPAAKSLKASQAVNEKTKNRIIGITVETRPDWCTDKEIIFLRNLGVTRVELGVQSLEDKVLTLVKRGHGMKEVIMATKELKEAGLKVCYHMMPGLPNATPETDLAGFKKLFSDPNYQPDLLKIYPCVVTRDSELLSWYQTGKYKPYDDETLTKLLVEIKKIIPPYVRILRLIRDIPSGDIVAGSKISNLREEVQKDLIRLGNRCRCVRCREVALNNKYLTINAGKLKLRETKYEASDGIEYFLDYIADTKEETLFALLRLRFPSYLYNGHKPLLKELEGATIIRELHTYGLALPIGSHKSSPQHKGLGQKLLQRAEEITKKAGIKKIAVTSGVGAREYYLKFGYKRQGIYMVKKL
ncbi:tRNA uridine(34) 5-carboxymethylaminomethyl modification radical SAM/GNAT enzyme Elp3 [Candidatus Gottesmanbacteria bacterium]|nr:tRNA uridine(34) 5-carboxymethylaminomethyl modification radical SAM/GNAT enzyme Elp3 [Candidatus Gottesmanbacteria bacterium]